MKKIMRYFISGFLLLIPMFIAYQLILIVSSVVTVFYKSNLVADALIAIFSITLLGWAFATFFKARIKKRITRLSRKPTVLGHLAKVFSNFDHISGKVASAFHNPVLYKVDNGIYKLGFITDKDMSVLKFKDKIENTELQANNEARPENAMWIYAPTPITMIGELVLVEKIKIRQLSVEESERIPLFILSAGLVEKLD